MNRQSREIAIPAAQYQALTEAAPVGIWHVGPRGETLYANPFLRDLFGSAMDHTQRQRPQDYFDVSPAETLDSLFGLARSFEVTVICNATWRPRVMVMTTGWLEGERANGAIVCFADVTKIADLEILNARVNALNSELADNLRKLQNAQEQIIKSGRMAQIGQLTATVAHELRNPLGTVRTSAFLLERKLKGKNLGIEAQLDRINSGIARCDNIISQLLDFTRSRPVQLQLVDLDEWLAKVVADIAEKLPAQVTVSCTLGLDGQCAMIDPDRLTRCVINLTANAAEVMVGRLGEVLIEGRAPRIDIETWYSSLGIFVAVSDNGPGISAENLSRIREPLFTTKSFGTGLGLPAVDKILEQHGGSLEIASVPGEGATFTIRLPHPLPESSVA